MGTSQETGYFQAEVPEPTEVQVMQRSSLSCTSGLGNTWCAGVFTAASGLRGLPHLHRQISWVDHSCEEPLYKNRQGNTCSEDPNGLWTQNRPTSCWENSREKQDLCGSISKPTCRLTLLHVFCHRYLSKGFCAVSIQQTTFIGQINRKRWRLWWNIFRFSNYQQIHLPVMANFPLWNLSWCTDWLAQHRTALKTKF